MRRLRVTHVIDSLAIGGAERTLCDLVLGARSAGIESGVITLRDGGTLASPLRDCGVRVESIGLQPGRPRWRPLEGLARRLRGDRADLIVTWLYYGNLLGGLAAWTVAAARRRMVWNICHTDFALHTTKPLTRLVARAAAPLSHRLPTTIVYVAAASRVAHEAAGYCRRRGQIVPNGFDTEQFRPDPAARQAVRRELGLPCGAPVVGLVARHSPEKDVPTFVAAAARLRAVRADVQVVLCGPGMQWGHAELAASLNATQPRGAWRLLGTRDDMPRVIAALDLVVSSSVTEASPRVLGEAMACGVPCVVTDVGGSAELVADTGLVVPPSQPDALAAACQQLLALPPERRAELGQRARRRIERHYSLQAMIARHVEIWTAAARADLPRSNPLRNPRVAAGRPRSVPSGAAS